jgi:hypothetical protein
MQPAMDGETMKVLEQLGIQFDGISGVYTMKGSPEFYFDFKKHIFTLDNIIPEECFPVMGPDKAFGEEMVTALYAQLEQYLIKDMSSREKIKRMLTELKKLRSPVHHP